MMRFFNSLTLLALLASTALAVRVPNADTPLFYLVSTSSTASASLLPLRLNGGTSGNAALTGNGPIAKLYFYQGKLVALDPAGSTFTYRPVINAIPMSTGCTTYGALGFVQGSSSDKCARYDSFQIQSDIENSQLGAKLVFNYQGGFFSCGSTQDVWYKDNANEPPSNCVPIDLYTVPVD